MLSTIQTNPFTMKSDIENNPDNSAETNTLLEKSGQKIKINAIHHENTLYARICGCIMYHWNGDAIKHNIIFCSTWICFIILTIVTICIIFQLIVLLTTHVTNHYPQFTIYNSTDTTYSINNTKHQIDTDYESCYVEENKEHCRKYYADLLSMFVKIIFSAMFFVVGNIIFPILFSTINGSMFSFVIGIAFAIMNILFFVLYVMLVIHVFGNTELHFMEIHHQIISKHLFIRAKNPMRKMK